MTVFKAIQAINVLYVIGMIAIATFNNIIRMNPESSIWQGMIVVFAVLFISIPNILTIRAVPPKLKLIKTSIVLNAICISLFALGLSAYDQEKLAIQWAVTVISICSINIVALVSALFYKRGSQSNGSNVVHS